MARLIFTKLEAIKIEVSRKSVACHFRIETNYSNGKVNSLKETEKSFGLKKYFKCLINKFVSKVVSKWLSIFKICLCQNTTFIKHSKN